MSDQTKEASQSISGARLFGFFTVLLILTLNADNGRDILDVTVQYIQAKAEAK